MTLTRPPHLVVLHCPAGGGHRAAAEAVAEAAGLLGCEATVVDALSLTPPWFAHGYVSTHLGSTRYVPWAYGLGYRRLDQRHPALDRVRRRLDAALGRRLLERVLAMAPHAVVATHFFPLTVLGRARRRGLLQAPLVGVVTDYTAHAFWADAGVDVYCTGGGGAAQDLSRHGVPAAACRTTGIPTRPAFGGVRPWAPPAPGEPLRVLVTSGGFGVGATLSVLRSLRSVPAVSLTVVCGRDERLADRCRELQIPGAEVVGFEHDMPGRLGAAHVVVGKAGGLTVSEALAAGRPMLTVGTCPGQEQQNETWLEVNGAGLAVVAGEVGITLGSLRDSGRLATMARRAARLGAPQAAQAVVEAALDAAALVPRCAVRARPTRAA